MAQSQTTFGKVTNTKHPLLLDTTCVFFQQRFLSFICLFPYHLSHRPSQPLMLRRFGGRVSRLQKWMTIIVGTQRYNVYIYYMIITYIISYNHIHSMSQLCGLWSIYTIFQHFNRCIFPASLFFNCKNQKNTFRFLGFFLPCFSLFNLSHPREAFSMGRKRQTFRFRHETRIWEIQWNPFGIFLGRNESFC